MAAADTSGASSASENEGAQGEDEVDFWDRRPKTLLERFRQPPVTLEDLEDWKKSGEDFNIVEDVQDDKTLLGYAPIHYIITGKHKNKVELLRLLAIVTNADLDLTSTKQGHTALHLAVENGDLGCIKTLVALGANVNKVDLLRKTPLDTARMKSSKLLGDDVRMKRLGGPTVFVEGTEARMRGFSQTIELSTSTEEESTSADTHRHLQPQQSEDEITTQLLSVGAVSGLMLPQANRESPESSSPLLKKRKTSADEFSDSTKISCTYYKQLEDDIHAKLYNGDCEPTAAESHVLVRQLQLQARYRRRFGSRILCLDGGGIRGLIQLAILQELENRMGGKKITELFDWIIGTSTGGIIALAMIYGPQESGMTVKQLRNMYWQKKNEIFTKSSDGLLGFLAKGNSEKLEEMLKSWLGESIRLDSVNKPKVLIPAVYKKESNVDLHFFNNCFDKHPSNVDPETSLKLSSQLVWKVARCTSAAPFYFTEFDDYIDGGVLANNPSEEALTAIQDYYRQKGEKLPISLLVSIGSGINPSKSVGTIDVHTKLLNPKAWLNFFDVMGDAVLNKTAHRNCESRCREQGIEYFRFNPPLSQAIDSGQKDSTKLVGMLWETRQYLHSFTEEVDKLVSLLRASELVTV